MRKAAMKNVWLIVLALTGAVKAANAPMTFTGVITDTLCGVSHAMMKARSDADCVKLCVKGSGEYALFDGQNVLKLSDQKTPAKFAAQKVRVTGSYDEKTKTIKVTSIELANQ
jgi:hypothetical protein